MLLILDLDETLIFATENKLYTPEDFICGEYFVYKRPHLDDFLDSIKKYYDIAVWTSSTRAYAEMIVDNIFPQSYPLTFLWARDRCTRRLDVDYHKYYNLKNLKKVKKKGYSLNEILIVDDTPGKVSLNYGNHIRVEPFEGDLNDKDLLKLEKYLFSIKDILNVRVVEKRGWKNKVK